MKPARIYCAVIALLSLGTAFLPAQTVIQVAAGVDGIKAALAAAAPGDIIELTTAGGAGNYYIEQTADSILKTVTIRGAAGLSKKPEIVSGSDGGCLVVVTGSLTLKGVKFEGLPNGVPFGHSFVYIKAPAAGTPASPNFTVKVDNCEFTNWQYRAMETSDATATPVDSIIVTNSIFAKGYRHAFYLKATRNSSNIFPGAARYFLMENCLVHHITSTGSDGQATYLEPGNRDVGTQGWPTTIINHLTVDSCAGGGINTYTTPGALVKNSIVVMYDSVYSYMLESGRFAGSPATNLMNSMYFYPKGVKKAAGAVNLGNSLYSLAVLTNVTEADPQFNDVAAGDYTLKSTSPAKGIGTDGKDLGYVPGGLTSVEPVGNSLPESFQLSQNYPNPFNPATTIEFSVPKTGQYSIRVYNMLGQEVATVFDQEVTAGNYSTRFDGQGLASGMYVYTLRGTGVVMTKTMMLLK